MDRDTKRSPRLDDQLKHEVESMTRGAGIESRADESRLKEDATERPLDDDELNNRSDIARFLEPSIFPASKEQILASASEKGAYDWIVRTLKSLPEGSQFENVEAIWEALGGEPEQRF